MLRGLLPLLLLFGCAPAAEPPMVDEAPQPPALTLAPRVEWRPIAIDRRGGIAAAFEASEAAHWTPGLRRVWIVLNLGEPIRLPETGGRARSVAFLADYRCTEQSWRPLEGSWYRAPDAQGLEFEERPRLSEERGVQPGTLVAVFFEAACRL
ncbi:surface-adhesin E family protein [Dankookia sp. GCM10030260]|uniref:surface-adhesin E family protein n=1 Tax=Dankookia sp. GCM10030260 TaxID=3273390 RepID=UPI00360AD649